ncbi:MAG: LacI family DNA-binding transcriptional regulator [Desertimonas sp.]
MDRPTMDDVAARAGVSRALVSLALRGSPKVSARSRGAIMTAVDELDYRPNLVARQLASTRTRTIGVVVNDLHNPFFPPVTDGVHNAAGDLDYRLLVSSAFRDHAVEEAAVDAFAGSGVEGIILVGTTMGQGAIEHAATRVPLVVVTRPLRSSVVDTVNGDDPAGARLAVRHLLGLGHRRIAHVSGGAAAGAPRRRAGYEQAMIEAGLEPLVVEGSFTEASGAAAATMLFEHHGDCTAVFAGNDLSALGALDVIAGRGLDVPGDVSLCGYDNTFVAALRHIGLTTVDQRAEELGRLAVEVLIERLEQGRTEARHETMAPTLVVRDTTAVPRR